MATRAAATGTAAVVTTWATVTAVAAAVGCTATGFAAGAEIAELPGEFSVERIVEADGNHNVFPTKRFGIQPSTQYQVHARAPGFCAEHLAPGSASAI